MSGPTSPLAAVPRSRPPEACRPPTWRLWECELPSGGKATTESPLADFHAWAAIARQRIASFGLDRAAAFGEGWVIGIGRPRRRPAPARRITPMPALPPTREPTERPAEPGELCTCGRPARVVYLTERFGEVGHCGASGPAPVLPCPFCGTVEPHRETWGDSARCPAYRLRPETKGGAPS
jgi:hypothetical protein